jgi:phospholipid transport system substrate-binding protein
MRLGSFALVLILVSAIVPAISRADAAMPTPAATPDGFVNALGGQTVDLLRQKQMLPAERERRFRALLHDGFDIGAMSRFVLGNAWRSATEPQREEFARLFEDYIVTAYSARLGQYSGERFTVTGSRPTGANGGSFVSSQILRTDGGPPTQIDWRVMGQAGSDYKINDVIVGGISLVLTQREEFASVIQRNGSRLDGLLQVLRDKARR